MKYRLRYIPILICVLAPLGLLAQGASRQSDISRNIKLFNAVVRQLEANYVDSIPVERSFQSAIDGLLSEIDPYTEYYNREETEAFRTMTSGKYAGIGSYIQKRDSGVYISGPFEGSPAQTAGLRTGDRIVRIDTMPITPDMKADQVTKLLKGSPGTDVAVTVYRQYPEPGEITATLTRRTLEMPSVPYHALLDGKTGYILLTSFMETSAAEVKDALKEFSQVPGLQGVILDLRSNGGGLVESAVDILSNFLPKGTEVLTTRGRDGRVVRTYRTAARPVMPDTPLAILIDGASASASEITAGAIQDYDRGVLVGQRSFGKGLVQSTFPLPYDHMVKITTQKYYIPSGRLIQLLDYTHRAPDGTVSAIPDSLTSEFTTAHGRKVRDGGGLMPDVTVESKPGSVVVYNLMRDFWIEDFATRYAAMHPAEIPDIDTFEITDSIYAEFKDFVDPGRFKQDKVCDQILDELEKAADAQGYMDEDTKARFEDLRTALTHDLNSDLDTNRERIGQLLAREIINRYHGEKGQIAAALRYDQTVKEAVSLLQDPESMHKLGIVTK